MKDEKELTEEELKKVVGGIRVAKPGQVLQEAPDGTAKPAPTVRPGTVSSVIQLPDPPFGTQP